MNRASTYPSKTGFTLIEVSLAVLVVGLGLLSLFGLFPSGLRAGEEAGADTRSGLFATVLFEGMRANASTVKVWTEWTDDAVMVPKLCANLDGVTGITADGAQHTINAFPIGSTRRVRYSLDISSAGRRYTAYLKVWERTGDNYSEFYTEFLFGGR